MNVLLLRNVKSHIKRRRVVEKYDYYVLRNCFPSSSCMIRGELEIFEFLKEALKTFVELPAYLQVLTVDKVFESRDFIFGFVEVGASQCLLVVTSIF